MFDKNKFAQILNKINNTYDTMTEFAEKSEVNRTYLSQYINLKLDKPPTPKILMKIAQNSNNVANYEDLMLVCGYINENIASRTNELLIELYNNLNDLENKYKNRHNGLTAQEEITEDILLNQVFQMLQNPKNTPETFNAHELVKDLEHLSNNSKNKIAKSLKQDFEYFYYTRKIENKILDIKQKDVVSHNNRDIPQFYMCPVYGQISAGQPDWAEECIEGRIPIDPVLFDIVNPEEHFFLRVNGESMNKLVRNRCICTNT